MATVDWNSQDPLLDMIVDPSGCWARNVNGQQVCIEVPVKWRFKALKGHLYTARRDEAYPIRIGVYEYNEDTTPFASITGQVSGPLLVSVYAPFCIGWGKVGLPERCDSFLVRPDVSPLTAATVAALWYEVASDPTLGMTHYKILEAVTEDAEYWKEHLKRGAA